MNTATHSNCNTQRRQHTAAATNATHGSNTLQHAGKNWHVYNDWNTATQRTTVRHVLPATQYSNCKTSQQHTATQRNTVRHVTHAIYYCNCNNRNTWQQQTATQHSTVRHVTHATPHSNCNTSQQHTATQNNPMHHVTHGTQYCNCNTSRSQMQHACVSFDKYRECLERKCLKSSQTQTYKCSISQKKSRVTWITSHGVWRDWGVSHLISVVSVSNHKCLKSS